VIGGRRAEEIDWTRNDAGLSLVNNRTVEALAVREAG